MRALEKSLGLEKVLEKMRAEGGGIVAHDDDCPRLRGGGTQVSAGHLPG
jgi:hypothetical protein